MNVEHISYPKIEGLAQVIKEVAYNTSYAGRDDDGQPIYDPTRKKPTLEFEGTVKLHGTNASVCFNGANYIWYQSRENVITPEKDNYGFATWAESKRTIFVAIFAQILEKYNLTLSPDMNVSIYGEWAGKGIQSGVAISELPKAFYVFGLKITKGETRTWEDFSFINSLDAGIYNIKSFPTYSITIDFDNRVSLAEAQKTLVDITEAVEKECPVAASLGVSGVGEGVVWKVAQPSAHSYLFKVKGEKHSASKVKTLVPLDVEKVKSIAEFVERTATENRFKQALSVIFADTDIDIKKMGDVIRWVVNDIAVEEKETLEASGLTDKDVNKEISNSVRKMFLAEVNKV